MADGTKPPEETDPPAGTEGAGGDGGGETRTPEELLEDARKKGRENAALRKRLKDAEKALEDAQAATMTEQEKLIAQARKEGFEEAEKKYVSQLNAATVKAVAANYLTNPEDAVLFLEVESITSEDEVHEAIKALIAERPYLAKKAPGQGQSIEQGPRGTQAAPATNGSEFLRKAFGR